jgi:hypothetical protein
MSVPTTRTEFAEFCLRKLGKPVLEINVDEDQVDDRIDEALKYYYDFHFDGTELLYYKHQINANNVSQKYITLPENIIGAVRIFRLGDSLAGGGDMFNIRYQIALNDLYTLTSVSMVPYYMTMQHLALLSELLVGERPIRYNRHVNKLYVDTDWNTLNIGEYLLVEAYSVVDPATYPDVFGDRWLQEYATALIKQQWGTNMKKFDGMQLPGGVTMNGQKIYDEATDQIEKMRQEMSTTYSLPTYDMIG